MRSCGKIILAIATALVIYAVIIFDPSVVVGSTRVVNIQKLGWQQNLTIVGMGLGIIGTLLVIFGPKEPKPEPVYSSSTRRHYRSDDAALEVEEKFAEAIRRGDLATMNVLLTTRAISPHGGNRNGKGWLQYATALGSTQAAKTLLEHGAMPGDRDDLGKSAFEEAETRSNGEILALFTNPTLPPSGPSAA